MFLPPIPIPPTFSIESEVTSILSKHGTASRHTTMDLSRPDGMSDTMRAPPGVAFETVETQPLPPPPPPPPPLSSNPPKKAKSSAKSLVLRRENMDQVEEQHEDLRDAREDLLGLRYKLKADRREIWQTRNAMGEKEGSLFNQLRLFLHDRKIELPSDVRSVLQEVDKLHDRLGVLEAEYGEAEERYDLQELQYNHKETTFINTILNVAAKTTPTLGETPATDLSELTLFAHGSPHNSNVEESAIQSGSLNAITRLAERENQSISSSDRPVPRQRTGFVPNSEDAAAAAKQLRDQSMYLNSTDWAETKKRIDQWLTDLMFFSRFQRKLLSAMECKNETPAISWSRRSVHGWDQIETSYPTIPSDHLSEKLSVAELAVPEPDFLEIDATQVSSLLPEKKNFDGFEDTTNPPSIESDDLWDVG